MARNDHVEKAYRRGREGKDPGSAPLFGDSPEGARERDRSWREGALDRARDRAEEDERNRAEYSGSYASPPPPVLVGFTQQLLTDGGRLLGLIVMASGAIGLVGGVLVLAYSNFRVWPTISGLVAAAVGAGALVLGRQLERWSEDGKARSHPVIDWWLFSLGRGGVAAGVPLSLLALGSYLLPAGLLGSQLLVLGVGAVAAAAYLAFRLWRRYDDDAEAHHTARRARA